MFETLKGHYGCGVGIIWEQQKYSDSVVSTLLYVKDHDVLDQHSSCKYGREEMETIWEAKIVELLL